MAVTAPEKWDLRINSFPLGLKGKAPVARFLEIREVRKAAKYALFESRIVNRKTKELKEYTAKHDLNKVIELAEYLVDRIHRGLQNTYTVLIKEYIFLMDKLNKDDEFLTKHGSKLSEEDRKLFGKFLNQVFSSVSKTDKYVNELAEEVRGKREHTAALNVVANLYLAPRTVAPRLVQAFFLRAERTLFGMEAKASIKHEGKISALDERGEISSTSIRQLLKLDKVYAAEFDDIVTKMFIYILLLVRSANDAANEIWDASRTTDAPGGNRARFDLPSSYNRLYAEPLRFILKEEFAAIQSLNKSRLQIESRINDLKGKHNL